MLLTKIKKILYKFKSLIEHQVCLIIAGLYLPEGFYVRSVHRCGRLVGCIKGGAIWFRNQQNEYYLISIKDESGNDLKYQKITCADALGEIRETWQFFHIIKKEKFLWCWILHFKKISNLTNDLRAHPHLKLFIELDKIFNNIEKEASLSCGNKQFKVKF